MACVNEKGDLGEANQLQSCVLNQDKMVKGTVQGGGEKYGARF